MDRLGNLEYIISYLKAEDQRFADLQMPQSLGERQQLMRALLNIREPRPVSKEFLKAQNAELQLQLKDKGAVIPTAEGGNGFIPMRLNGQPEGVNLYLWQGDITRVGTDAIVNAANKEMLGCFVPLHNCIDNAIHSAAGVELRLECYGLMRHIGRPVTTAEAFTTHGYNLPAPYVIHTVGPIIPDGRPTPGQETQLANCYRHCLEQAESHNMRSITFCCISTGVFLFPQKRAAEIATSATMAWLRNHNSGIKTVIFNVFKDSDYVIYQSLCRQK